MCYVGVLSPGYASRWRKRHSVIVSVKHKNGARSQTMYTEGAAASSGGPCMYIVYMLLQCTCIMYAWGSKSAFVRTKKPNNSIAWCALQYCTQHAACTNTFDRSCLPAAAVQQRQHVDVVVCLTLFSGLISKSVFDVLQIPSECIRISSGCISSPHPHCYGPDHDSHVTYFPETS